ncbi:MAG: patatin-like phospholipase family protein, partial [Crocinitomicaceae bacterium]|nr:patatin-like phospholipase family protein [Crocinitomicaceae bacterium]
MKRKKTLIIQGGGFRTGFSTGVLDAFQKGNHTNFDIYIGISGGAIALSYFLSEQREKCFNAMCLLAVDPNFISYSG